jgi:hypothetical protein
MASLSTILSWFKTGLTPTENQFAQSWSSFWHKDDSIPQSSITGLQTILNSFNQTTQQPDTVAFADSSGAYIIPAGKMLTVLIIESTTSQALNIGTAAGLTDLLEKEQIPANQPYAIHLDVIAERSTSRMVYLSFEGPLTISFHKQNFYKQ